jgi:hypothetical protein
MGTGQLFIERNAIHGGIGTTYVWSESASNEPASRLCVHSREKTSTENTLAMPNGTHRTRRMISRTATQPGVIARSDDLEPPPQQGVQSNGYARSAASTNRWAMLCNTSSAHRRQTAIVRKGQSTVGITHRIPPARARKKTMARPTNRRTDREKCPIAAVPTKKPRSEWPAP